MTSAQATPSIALIAMLGSELKHAGQSEPNLERLIANPQCPEWVIPALVKLAERNISWGDALRVLDLPDTDGETLRQEASRFAHADPRTLIAMVVTEIATSNLTDFPTPAEYRRMRSRSAPSLVTLAMHRITWRAVQSRYEYQEYHATQSAAKPEAETVIPEAAVAKATHGIDQTATAIRSGAFTDLAKPSQTEAKTQRQAQSPTPTKPLAPKPNPDAVRIKAAIAKTPAPEPPASTKPAPRSWFQQQTDRTAATIQAAIIQLMHAHQVFGPTDYQQAVAFDVGPQPNEVARAFGSDFWFKTQDAYIAKYGANAVPKTSTERNWRALPIEEVFKRMHDEAQTLHLSSEFAYNSRRRPELAPSTIIVRTLCQEQNLDYRQLRNRFFGQLENHFIEAPRNFATYPLEYVLTAFHDGLRETGAKNAAEYDRAYNRRRHPSLAQVERVAARNSLTARDAYHQLFQEPEFPL